MRMQSMAVKGDERGFTLLELIVAFSTFSVVLAGFYVMYLSNQTTFARGQAKIEIQQGGRVALDMMAKYIRMAGYDPSNVLPSCATTNAVQAATANSITFVADVTGNAASPVSDKIVYRLQGSQIVQDFSKWSGSGCAWNANPSTIIAENISTLAFRYFDASNTEISSPVAAASLGKIRRITISVTTAKTAAGRQATFPLTMDVRLRNLP